jgi:hypothetical protein
MLSFLFTLTAVFPLDPPVAPPPRPVERQPLPPGVDPALADWTPRPATGPAEPWEKATDKDWIDPRFRAMNTGPFLDCTMRFPFGKGFEPVYKATVIKLGETGDSGAVFDRATMRLMAGWTGGYLNHSDRRFGLLNTPTPKGELVFASPAGPGWANPDGTWDAKPPFTAPLPRNWVRFRGTHVNGNRVVLKYTVGETEVLEAPAARAAEDAREVTYSDSLRIGPTTVGLKRHLFTLSPRYDLVFPEPLVVGVSDPVRKLHFGLCVAGETDGVELRVNSGEVYAVIPPSRSPRRLVFSFGQSKDARRVHEFQIERRELKPHDLDTLAQPGPRRWGEPIVTRLVRGDESGPFALDTLTIPYENPHRALFFCTGLDFLPDGRIAVCTCHGDVWLVTVNEATGTCSWQRFATGLYQPLGLKVVDGKVVVLERGQLTRLHDLNGDGEADFYECLTNDWHTGIGEHSYDTCLETDPDGNFYFFKTGDTDLPSGGCLLRASKDGGKVEVFATGFRHPIGLGISPGGIITGADQEGNWMPATRIDQYVQGGFYGDVRAHHRKEPPKLYDGPLCWIPREVDNSAGGQVWVPPNTFGPLAGLPLHFSYGRCRPFVLLRQELSDGRVQGGVAALDVTFLSGVCRGRFGPDGNLYACGLNGWQTAAKADGCLQRVRLTGKPLDVPVGLAVEGNLVRLTFSRPLDPKAASDPANYRAAWWNYRWSGEYGSKRWKVSDPVAEGQDDVPVRGVKLLADGRTVELTFDGLRPVMQMQVAYNVVAADGRKVVGSVFLTIHATGK